VWDYATDLPIIERTGEALAAYLSERMSDPEERETVARSVAMS